MYKLINFDDMITINNEAYIASFDGDCEKFNVYEEAFKWLLHKHLFLGLEILQPMK